MFSVSGADWIVATSYIHVVGMYIQTHPHVCGVCLYIHVCFQCGVPHLSINVAHYTINNKNNTLILMMCVCSYCKLNIAVRSTPISDSPTLYCRHIGD